ncbi:MAG: hypothetical protein NTZ35_08765 [Ignavibacteriales bacterium]|nr:hypothetical protein [Ignavibacteriales bacterium]
MRVLKHPSVAALFISLLVLVPLCSLAQKKTTEVKSPEPNGIQLSRKLAFSVQRFADSTLQIERRYSDSLTSVVAFTAREAINRIDFLADSLITSAHDSLDAPRKDTLRFITKSLQQQLLAFGDTTKQAVSGPISHFSDELTRGKRTYSACDSCESDPDFNDRFEQFREFVDNLHDGFHDTTAALMDDHKDLFQDKYDTIHDSLADLRDILIENRLDEIDYQRYVATRLTASTWYSSHTTYRGRDNGVPQQMIAPSLAFRHSSGFGIEISTYWLDQSPKRWDDVAASATYEFILGSLLGGEFSYSHFWFSDSSQSAKSVFKNDFGASFSLNWPVLSLSVDGDLATGNASEFTTVVSASHDFEFPLTLYNKISLEPTLTAIIGEQNSTLTTLRTKGVKGKKVVGVQTQTNNTFGILDYEVSFPITIVLGPLTLSPSVVYIVPMNVVDLSTEKAFVDFEFVVSLAFH